MPKVNKLAAGGVAKFWNRRGKHDAKYELARMERENKPMHINTALKKVTSLTNAQLRHFVRLCDDEIVNYRRVIANYSPELMESNGQPFLNQLYARQDVFHREMDRRGI
jgi:hypothetical protein